MGLNDHDLKHVEQIVEVAIDPTDSSAAGQKAQIQALKRELIDLLVEVQNLRQALARKEREE